MNINEVKQQIRNNIKIETIDPPKLGGQCCGIIYPRMRLYSEELDLTIESGHYKNKTQNKKLISLLFDLALDELIK